MVTGRRDLLPHECTTTYGVNDYCEICICGVWCVSCEFLMHENPSIRQSIAKRTPNIYPDQLYLGGWSVELHSLLAGLWFGDARNLPPAVFKQLNGGVLQNGQNIPPPVEDSRSWFGPEMGLPWTIRYYLRQSLWSVIVTLPKLQCMRIVFEGNPQITLMRWCQGGYDVDNELARYSTRDTLNKVQYRKWI